MDTKPTCVDRNRHLQSIVPRGTLTTSTFILIYQVGENQGVGGRPWPWSFGHPVQRKPGEQPPGRERRGDAEVLRGAQDAEVN